VASRGEYLRETVLEILQDSSEPMSAYDVLHELQKVTGKVAPPTVYRALSSLQNQRVIHRLESLNAYVVCNQNCMHNAPIISICDTCGEVEESASDELLANLSDIVQRKGFAAERHVIEVHGKCSPCAEKI
tara:strand:- start:447 stop:839 length:393 start_codon:yes stop_codon:yes gene_type:complete